MDYAIISTFNFKGQDVRFAFNDDDTFIFIEDSEKLHHFFSATFSPKLMDPKDIITISVKEPGKDPEEHKVASIFGSGVFHFCSHWEGTDTYWEIYHWLYGVKNSNSEYKWFMKENAARYHDPKFRRETLEQACKFKNLAEQMVLKERFFIDMMSKSADKETTFDCLGSTMEPESAWDHVDSTIPKEAPNEAPIA